MSLRRPSGRPPFEEREADLETRPAASQLLIVAIGRPEACCRCSSSHGDRRDRSRHRTALEPLAVSRPLLRLNSAAGLFAQPASLPAALQLPFFHPLPSKLLARTAAAPCLPARLGSPLSTFLASLAAGNSLSLSLSLYINSRHPTLRHYSRCSFPSTLATRPTLLLLPSAFLGSNSLLPPRTTIPRYPSADDPAYTDPSSPASPDVQGSNLAKSPVPPAPKAQ